MKSIRIVASAILLAAFAMPATAIIALRDVQTVTQPDGTTLNIRKVGDEFRHFTLTEDGAVLTMLDGYYTYARQDADGRLVSTGIKARNAEARTDAERAVITPVESISANVRLSPRSAVRSRAVAQSGLGLASNSFPVRGKVKSIVILVQYQDVKFTHPKPSQYFTDMLTKKGFNEYGGTGSALDFFSENSNGIFTPEFDVYGPITLKNKRAYYGGNDSYYDEDMHPEEMVIEACQQLNAMVNFADYDTNGDGLIDNIFVFYAGQGEASYGPAESVWPHSWDVRAVGMYRFDGVTLATYGCTNEWELSRPDGVGTFIHEFSHVMGLPDLYDTAGSLTCTPGSWSALDYGPYNNNGCTPPNYGAYERNALGWVDPMVITGPSTIALPPISENVFALIPTSSTNEFFLLENRQKNGWDAYVPGHGMLIWHIDCSKPSVFANNTVNNTRTHQYVDIEEANGTANSNSKSTEAGYPFPGTSKKTSFTSTTKPAMTDWSGRAIDLPLTDIAENNGIITFKVAGGAAPIETPVHNDVEVGQSHFVASWNPVDGATDYFLTVHAVMGDNGGEDTNDFGSGSSVTLPAGWTATKSEGYATSGNYGAASPSFKFGSNGVTLTSPRYESPINYISFWTKGQQADGSTLDVEGQVNGNWVKIATLTPVKTEVEEVELTDIPADVYQMRMVYNKSKGNLSLDDIVIRFGVPDVVLEHYNEMSTGGETSWRCDNLIEGHKEYRFSVRATDGTYTTGYSAPSYVTVEKPLAVGSISVDDCVSYPVVYYNLQGIRVDRPASGDILIRVQGTTTTKVRIP